MSEPTVTERLDRLAALIAGLLDDMQDHEARLTAMQMDVNELFRRSNADRAKELEGQAHD